MTFFVGKDLSFIKQQVYENYNGYLASVYNIDLDIIKPELSVLDLKQYPFENIAGIFKICVSSNTKHLSLISKSNNFIIWHTSNIHPKILINIIKDFSWIKILNSLNMPIAFLLKENESFYLYRNVLGNLYFDENLNISTKQFINSELLDSNVPFLIDFKNETLTSF